MAETLEAREYRLVPVVSERNSDAPEAHHFYFAFSLSIVTPRPRLAPCGASIATPQRHLFCQD